MWEATTIKTYQKKFKLDSSTQKLTSLEVSGLLVINMLEELVGRIKEDQIFQTMICPECGIYRCQAGNWVALRRLGDVVFVIPAFEKWLDKASQKEYSAPHWFEQKGALWLSLGVFEEFKALIPALSSHQSVRQMTPFEALNVYVSEAPHGLFKTFSTRYSLKETDILMADDGVEHQSIVALLNAKLHALEHAKTISIEPIVASDKVVFVFIDNALNTPWKALCKTNDTYTLLLGNRFKIIIDK